MLKLLFGPDDGALAQVILTEIKNNAEKGTTGQILIVPEQYSHMIERQLCAVGGDSISLYAEVLSFRRLARRVFEREGGLAAQTLTDGGRLLTMAVCLSSLRDRLTYFSARTLRPELCSQLLDTVTDMKNACIEPEDLSVCAVSAKGSLANKLRDMALIYGAYQGLTRDGPGEPDDVLSLLAEKLECSDFAAGRQIYLLGFTDFTGRQNRIIHSLMDRCAHLTLALNETGDGSTQQKTAAKLTDHARLCGIEVSSAHVPGSRRRAEALEYFSRNLLTYSNHIYKEDSSAIVVAQAPDMEQECTLAACRIARLVREKGWRYRDITLAVRGYSAYESTLQSVFERFGIPLYTGKRQDMALRSEIAAILAALRTVLRGYEYEDMFAYLKTGLGGLTLEETDILENYVLQWSIRGIRWKSDVPWKWHPENKGGALDEKQKALLERINRMKDTVIAPLTALEEALSVCRRAEDFCAAIYSFSERIGLMERLTQLYNEHYTAGQLEKAEEYRQLWTIFTDALDQFVAAAGQISMTAEEFYSFFSILISSYSAGIIPVAVDRVNSGDLLMTRYAQSRALFLLGANEGVLPPTENDAGIFTLRDRALMKENGVILDETDMSQREMDAICAALAVPDELLYISYLTGGDHAPSFVIDRLTALFQDNLARIAPSDEQLLASPEGCFLLACRGLGGEDSKAARAAEIAFRGNARLEDIRRAITYADDTLCAASVEGLYGKKLLLSPSKTEQYNSCRFAYYMQYGLKARPRIAGEFEAMDAGTFVHYILQTVCSKAKASGGFGQVTDEMLTRWVTDSAADFVFRELDNFENRTKRAQFLFERLVKSTLQVVLNLAEELRSSSFEPMAFELKFGYEGDLPPIEYPEAEMSLIGTVDRVDGWIKDGKLYLRVVDYKTGRKTFDLSDVWNGLSLQMLIYLFALQSNSDALYKGEVIPAGILYVPARSPMVSMDLAKQEEQAASDRDKELQRKGLLLADMDALYAMEHSDKPRFLPITVKDGVPMGSLATPTQFKQLRRYISDTLVKLSREIRSGLVSPDPFLSSRKNVCEYCDFSGACRFEKKRGRVLEKLSNAQFWANMSQSYEEDEYGAD